ncbi:malonyl-[acyl-carrier protein] O-methyltransferase [Peptococcaceae bacterium CEB3]|nr:malonyl-[acyl-carrier protein] O-methyltransferase [Peptococcaceae bacterium CEB3]
MRMLNVTEFDKFAREVFAPTYPVIAAQIKEKSGITGGSCLDIGCGGGYLSIALAEITDLDIYLLDKNAEMLKIAQKNVDAHGLGKRVRTLLGDVHEIPLANQALNLVVSRGSMFLWENRQGAFQEIYRVLSPGGVAYIGTGFGTAELQKQITAKMIEIDKDWAEKVKDVTGEKSVQIFQKVLEDAKIPEFKITQDHTGLWISIWK